MARHSFEHAVGLSSSNDDSDSEGKVGCWTVARKSRTKKGRSVIDI